LPYVSAATSDGRHLLIGGRPELQGSRQLPPSLYIVELATEKVETITLSGWPRLIILDEERQNAWVNSSSGGIIALSLRDRTYRVLTRLERGLDGMAGLPAR
jgi:hypothetical protein